MPQGPSETVYLNHADRETLAKLPGLDAQRAGAIVEARPFASWDEVERAAGLDQTAINTLRSQGADLGEPSDGPIFEPGSGGSAASPAGNVGKA